MTDDFLLQVQKPARYIGSEWNVSKKDFAALEIKFALCFADLYEVGMSNLGMRIIYGILNDIADTCCERFFSPALDMENILRNHNLEILSLESKKKLKEFDIIGFSLSHELGYTNVLNILDLGKIPLKSSLRDHSYPLVIGGGPCVLNPEPIHEFFDLFVIGEAEELILELIALYRKAKDRFKSGKIAKEDLLIEFCSIEGVYVPSLYEVKYNPQSLVIEEFRPKYKGLNSKIKKRFIKNLDSAYFSSQWLLPYVQIVHDRITLEIMRGCPNQCRFCQARAAYFPFRQKSVNNIINCAHSLYKSTGYEEISLAGLSVSDHSQIQEIIKKLTEFFQEKKVNISLPSLKPKAMLPSLASLIAGTKKTGLTFAPEVASEKLRKMINKDFEEETFLRVLEEVYLAGYQHIKLYFMIGLPLEEQADLDAIIELTIKASELRRKLTRYPAQVNISINTLIPKPHTSFQWFKMEDSATIKEKQTYLKNKIKNKKIKLNFHDYQMSFLEGVLARGDRRLSQVILAAFFKGARFDGWGNYFLVDKWHKAFLETKIDPVFYLREKSSGEFLPWDFLDVGIDKDILFNEFNKIIAQK